MSIAPLPTPLQHLGGRRFSFYPPIRNLQPNEWLYRRATWSECIVMNARSGEEVCIPRMFLGEVSGVDEAVMIVGLNRELEWRAGAIIPQERRVIELPVAVNDSRARVFFSIPGPHLAPVINIRLEPQAGSSCVEVDRCRVCAGRRCHHDRREYRVAIPTAPAPGSVPDLPALARAQRR